MKPYAPVKRSSEAEEALLSQGLTSSGSDHEYPATSIERPVRGWTLTEVVLIFLLISSNAGWLVDRLLSSSGPHEIAYCKLS